MKKKNDEDPPAKCARGGKLREQRSCTLSVVRDKCPVSSLSIARKTHRLSFERREDISIMQIPDKLREGVARAKERGDHLKLIHSGMAG